MEPENKAKSSFRRLNHSLQKPKTDGDIESAGDTTTKGGLATLSSGASVAKQALVELLESIQQKRHQGSYDKRLVYNTLMTHLDKAEKSYTKSTLIHVGVELLVFSGLAAALVCSLVLDSLNRRRVLHLRTWQYITMAVMLFSGLSIVRFLTFVATWPITRWWRIHKYVVYIVRQMKRCVDVTLWFCVVLLGWYVWFRPRLNHVHGELSVVVAMQTTRFLIALCIGSFLWVLKNILYLKLEADLHYDQLFDRVQLAVAYLHGIQIVHNTGMWRFLTDSNNKKKLRRMVRMKVKMDGSVHKDELVKGNNIWREVMEMEKESVPIWILRRLADEYLDQLRFRPLPGSKDLVKDDQKLLREAKSMLKRIKKVKDRDLDPFQDEIKREDLLPYNLSEEDLDYIFRRSTNEDADGDEINEHGNINSRSSDDKPIGHDEFLNWTVRAYKNCWGLEQTLSSSMSVFVKLNRLLSSFVVTVVVIIWLLLSGTVETAQLALLFTPFLAASFIFGDSCKKMFEGLIFAFAMHPFDVGDRVIINDAQMRVTKLKILTSVFFKYDTGEEVIIPNSILTTTNIINLNITPDQSDKLEFVVDRETPLEDIKDLEIRIQKLLDEDLEYSSSTKVVKSEICKEYVRMSIYFKYLVSYLGAETKAVHKSKILTTIMKFLKKMEINRKEYFPSYEPFTVEITLDRKIKLSDVEELESEILSGLDNRYKPYSKVVMTELTKSTMKMGVYMGSKYMWKARGNEDENSPQTNRLICVMEKQLKDEQMRNLVEISEAVKRAVPGVNLEIQRPVKDGDDEVIAHGGLGWSNVKASNVIETQDVEKKAIQTIPANEGAEVKVNMHDNASG